ncbi:MAG: hypothetical protein EAZ70_06990 [Runella slithyformis]|nr:MAG: hypothetical protein EAY79_06350 [Runella slithyformis]TAE99448.1 MAG: hypothetical protein EAZ80_04930 [Runella slithyformis]TAF27545.1 MAG: hypothetical protein EAZ70_06990 [Runella slithyformis]TAF46059.1 MAG: hypothetical protein EAZ63_09950 [Runella slithyformis]TAF82241.1 MAG: hypothetical protein EAZ50_04390 [Runella slithyformis]
MKNTKLLKYLSIQIAVVWLTFGLAAEAQNHLKGQRFFEGYLGTVDGFHPLKGSQILLSTGKYNRHHNAWKATVSYQRKVSILVDSTNIPQEQFTLGYGYELILHRNATRTFFVRGLAQPFVGYESINQNQAISETASQRSKLLVGLDAGLEIEINPVIFGFRQRWSPTSLAQAFHSTVFVGVRWHRK